MSLNLKTRTRFDGWRNFWLRDGQDTKDSTADLGDATVKVFDWHAPRLVVIELSIRGNTEKRVVKKVPAEFAAMARGVVTGHVPLVVFADYLEETNASRFGTMAALMRALESKTHNAIFEFERGQKPPQPWWKDGTICLKSGTLLIHDASAIPGNVRHSPRRLEMFFDYNYFRAWWKYPNELPASSTSV